MFLACSTQFHFKLLKFVFFVRNSNAKYECVISSKLLYTTYHPKSLASPSHLQDNPITLDFTSVIIATRVNQCFHNPQMTIASNIVMVV